MALMSHLGKDVAQSIFQCILTSCVSLLIFFWWDLRDVVIVELLLLPLVWFSFLREHGVRRCKGNDTASEIFQCKRFGFFMGLRKLNFCRNDFGYSFKNWQSLLVWCNCLGVCVINYCDFGQLTGCFDQFCLFIVSLHVLSCAFTIALFQLTLCIVFY